MKTCGCCGRQLPESSRFCTQCGTSLDSSSAAGPSPSPRSVKEELNIPILYAMVALLLLALVFPPWETPPSRPPEFLGFHFIFSPPEPEAVVSRPLMTIELVTIAIAGLYCSWLFRRRTNSH